MDYIVKRLKAPNGQQIELNAGLFINNEFVPGSSPKIWSIDPAGESEICAVEAASPDDVDRAVQAAREAFKGPWGAESASVRGQLLYRLADFMERKKEVLATLESWDGGKPYHIALTEDLEDAIAAIRYYAGWADKIHGQTMSNAGPKGHKFGYSLKEPIGVCGLIIPWNYPLSNHPLPFRLIKLVQSYVSLIFCFILAMAAWKLGPALACGNTVVLKPAEQTPLSALYLASLVKDAGFPPGVVNIVNGPGRVTGAALAGHLGVDKIAFTGSTATGQEIMKLASTNLKNITLETGGKSPLIVFDDADLDQASKWAQIGIMSNQGQICTATSRLLVHRSIHDKFIERFLDVITEVNIIGDPFDDATFQGPQVSKGHHERILGFIDRAKQSGAELVLGGSPVKVRGKGYFIQPTVFTNVQPEHELFREEVFGPVAAVAVFDTEEEAIALSNCSRYGLGAAIFTQSIDRAHRLVTQIEAGMVWINSSQDVDVRLPFGGVKQSGIGRELGEAGLEAYTRIKAVHMNLGMKL